MASPDRPDEARPRGTLHARASARTIDALSVFFLLVILVVCRVLWFMHDASERFRPEPWGRAFVPALAYVVLSAVYEITFVAVRGQTPGKEAMNLRVVDERTMAPPTVARSALRWSVPGLAFLVPPLPLAILAALASGIPALGARRRAVHDVMAATAVIRYDANLEEGELRVGRRPRNENAWSRRILPDPPHQPRPIPQIRDRSRL